jgi:ubiquinone/menaquinone biosynthesis C-methylase UbiE
MLSDDMRVYYEAGREQARLTRGVSIEFTRTQELILRHAPPAPAVIYDIGGGTGPYAFWLAELGYLVHLRDKMPLHIEQAQQLMASHSTLASLAVGDARQVDLLDESAHLVLLLGPLYHLTEQEDRVQALREAYRLLRPGGVLLAVGISRYASLLDGMMRGLLDDPVFREIVRTDLATGQHRNPAHHPGYFTTAYFHQPAELRQEVQDAGFDKTTLYAVEGPLGLAQAAEDRWGDPELRERYLEAVRWIECDQALMAVSSHLMVVGNKSSRPVMSQP